MNINTSRKQLFSSSPSLCLFPLLVVSGCKCIKYRWNHSHRSSFQFTIQYVCLINLICIYFSKCSEHSGRNAWDCISIKAEAHNGQDVAFYFFWTSVDRHSRCRGSNERETSQCVVIIIALDFWIHTVSMYIMTACSSEAFSLQWDGLIVWTCVWLAPLLCHLFLISSPLLPVFQSVDPVVCHSYFGYLDFWLMLLFIPATWIVWWQHLG